MPIKAVFCDIDGTLLTSKGIVSYNTIQVIKELRMHGMLFGLCTGRDIKSVLLKLNEWGIDGMVDAIVGSGGAEIYIHSSQYYEVNHPLSGEHIKEIMKHYEDMDVNFAIPYQGILYAPIDDRHIRNLAKADKTEYKIVDFNDFLKKLQLKIMIVTDPNNMNNVIARSKTFHSHHFTSASLMTASELFEYMDPHVTKSNGLQRLMALYHYQMEQVCTFGDADNDYDMTKASGIGVVMANGSPKTKSIADYITDDCDHDGIATFIKQHLLREC